MATKTITLELDAYERLKRAKRSPRESFSSVVRRARFDDDVPTVADLLVHMERRTDFVSEEVLDEMDRVQHAPRVSTSLWEELPDEHPGGDA